MSTPPPARGARLEWDAIPEAVRADIEARLGSPVVATHTQPGGFSPGVAARLRTADGQRVFVKAVGSQPNPDSPAIHRQEARITAMLPPAAPVPRLRWAIDDAETGWVVLALDEIDGRHPHEPWQANDLDRVVRGMIDLSEQLTPSPLPLGAVNPIGMTIGSRIAGWRLLLEGDAAQRDTLDPWSRRNLEALADLESHASASSAGDTLLNFDIRADNILISDERVWFLDWPWGQTGAAWIDVLAFAPSVTMQGGLAPEDVAIRHPAFRHADPDRVNAVLAAISGMFTERSLKPPPPGLPTLREFQAGLGVVSRAWLAYRTGWQ